MKLLNLAFMGVFSRLLLYSRVLADIAVDCNLVQKRHNYFDGIGVFAGRDYQEGEVVERCVTFPFPEHRASRRLLDRYVFGFPEEGNVAVVLGYAMVSDVSSPGSC
jgi:hypothetical protein